MNCQTNNGFTLIEILVVVVIVSILTVMGVQMVNSGSVERNLQQHGRTLQATMEYACDQATLQNIPYGLKVYENSYSFVEYVNAQWLDVISANLSIQELTDGSLLTLKIDDSNVVLKEEEIELPQIVCQATGELTPFEVVISDATKLHHYQVKTQNFWQLEGQWLDEK
jgi:general secretion pathway protein H